MGHYRGLTRQVCVDVKSEPTLLTVLRDDDIRGNSSEGARIDDTAMDFGCNVRENFFGR